MVEDHGNGQEIRKRAIVNAALHQTKKLAKFKHIDQEMYIDKELEEPDTGNQLDNDKNKVTGHGIIPEIKY
eukprot:11887001-Heterocapsa_arctica.AAC.1